MPKIASSLELMLAPPAPGQTLGAWLYGELREALLAGRLKAGTRLPSSRELSQQHGLARGTVVAVLERLHAEGYLDSRVGAGTWVSAVMSSDRASEPFARTPRFIRQIAAAYERPKAFAGLTASHPPRPFRMRDADVTEFPGELWATLANRRSRNFRSWLEGEDDPRGYRPLREAISRYLGSSRGVRCSADQVIIVSGVQQALDLLARILLKPGDAVWMEDPGYFGASIAFENAGARIAPVPVDGSGIDVAAGIRKARAAKGAYVTPAHQFPLGLTMPLERRMALLQWASNAGTFIIEDDYDSEFRFEGRPVPVLQSLDRASNVIVTGSFNKLLFPSLRIGYIVAPPLLADFIVAFRHGTDFRSRSFDHAVLCDFIEGGHLARHLRRMRKLYAARLDCLLEAGRKQLGGVLEISSVRAGLYTTAKLINGMTSRQAEAAARSAGVEALALDRYTFQAKDPGGLLLGFAGFDERQIRDAASRLSRALR